MKACLLEDVRTHDEVRVPVAARVGPVRADPADLGGEMENQLRTRFGEEAFRVRRDCEVEVPPTGDERLEALRAQPLHQVGAEKPASPGHENAHAASVLVPW